MSNAFFPPGCRRFFENAEKGNNIKEFYERFKTLEFPQTAFYKYTPRHQQNYVSKPSNRK